MNLVHPAAILSAALTLPCWAVDFHATTAQEFQNALTTAATNGADDTIYLAAGFYQGNFSFTSAEANALTVEAEPGLSRGDVTLDGAGTGGALNLASSVVSNFMVRRITISRNCGSIDRDALRLATKGTVEIQNIACLSASKAGRGIHVAAGASLVLEDSEISATGTADTGQGIWIEGVEGTVTLNRNLVKGNRYAVNTDGCGIRIIGTTANNVVIFNSNTIQNNFIDPGSFSNAWGGGFTSMEVPEPTQSHSFPTP